MFVSIIVPVYNVEKYLRECLDSIIAQTYRDYEVILVDDGSVDSSPNICDEYAKKDDRISVIHKQNGGLSDARNAGLRKAKGEYIIFIDSDDYISATNFLETLFIKCQNKPDVVLYKFKEYLEDVNKFVDCSFSFPKSFTSQRPASIINALVENDAFYCAAWTKCIRANVLKKNNIEFERGITSEDQEWYYHVIKVVRNYEMVDYPFIVYRKRKGSITSSWTIKNLTDSLYVLEKWKTAFDTSDLDNEMKKALNGSLAKLYCNMLIGYARFNDSQKSKMKNKIKGLSVLLKYRQNRRVKIIGKIYSLVGFGGTVTLLRLLDKIGGNS
jgi:glycosyltransferase involved in cell wall biosynthesis